MFFIKHLPELRYSQTAQPSTTIMMMTCSIGFSLEFTTIRTRTTMVRPLRRLGRVLNVTRGGLKVTPRVFPARAGLGQIFQGSRAPPGLPPPNSGVNGMSVASVASAVDGFTLDLPHPSNRAGYPLDLTREGTVGIAGNVSLYVDQRHVKANSFREFNLHPMGRTINDSDNLSDSSLISEAYSAHVLGCTFAQMGRRSHVRNTETNIRYRFRSKRTDYVLELDKPINDVDIVAVEVKRLSDFGGKVDLTDQYVYNLLSKANVGARESNKSVHPSDRWHTQILHVITDVPETVQTIQYWCDTTVDPGFSWVFVTVVSGNSRVILGY